MLSFVSFIVSKFIRAFPEIILKRVDGNVLGHIHPRTLNKVELLELHSGQIGLTLLGP